MKRAVMDTFHCSRLKKSSVPHLLQYAPHAYKFNCRQSELLFMYKKRDAKWGKMPSK